MEKIEVPYGQNTSEWSSANFIDSFRRSDVSLKWGDISI
jgi:hypothetical protein